MGALSRTLLPPGNPKASCLGRSERFHTSLETPGQSQPVLASRLTTALLKATLHMCPDVPRCAVMPPQCHSVPGSQGRLRPSLCPDACWEGSLCWPLYSWKSFQSHRRGRSQAAGKWRLLGAQQQCYCCLLTSAQARAWSPHKTSVMATKHSKWLWTSATTAGLLLPTPLFGLSVAFMATGGH